MNYFFTDASFGNLALHVEDNPYHVAQNREKLSTRVGGKKLIFMDQVHGDTIEVVDRNSLTTVPECDAMLTNDSEVALCVMVADCIPVILYDEVKNVIGVAHAGRTGSYKNIVGQTILKMQREFTCEDIKVVFGPSIRKCCYEVGMDVIEGFLTENGVPLEEFTCKENEKIYLDLIALNSRGLKNVEISPTCTCCDEGYFSYRRDGLTGRFCGVVTL